MLGWGELGATVRLGFVRTSRYYSNNMAIDALTLAGYVYAKPSNESTLVTNGRGNSIIDCVWFNPKTITFKACEIIDKQGGAERPTFFCSMVPHNASAIPGTG